MPQSSIREGLDSGATRINQRHKRNQQSYVLAGPFLTALARSQRDRRGRQTFAKKSVDINQATAYTAQLILKVIFRTGLEKDRSKDGGGKIMNERDHFLLALAARTARVSLRGAKSLNDVSNVVVVSILLGLCSPAYSQTAARSPASDRPVAAQAI